MKDMRRLVWVVAALGLVLAGSVYGHANFEIHDGGEQEEDVTAPGTENLSDEELSEFYGGILNEERTRATAPEPINELADVPEDERGEVNLNSQSDQLPWQLLSVSLDADRDGLSGIDERRVGTDVANPDSDGDGFLDGLEVVRGYNLPRPGSRQCPSGRSCA